MIHRPDFMIVSGNGRNTGKTSFVEQVIKNNSGDHQITAIKVSPHFHRSDESENLLAGSKDFLIREEKDKSGTKDSSRLLRAGAIRVYYIEAKDHHLKDALNILIESEGIAGPVICESGGMRKFIKPSMTVLLNAAGRTEFKSSYRELSSIADKFVIFNNGEFDPSPKQFIFNGKRWAFQSL